MSGGEHVDRSKMTGLKFVSGPLPGFCSGASSPKPAFISRLLLMQLSEYL